MKRTSIPCLLIVAVALLVGPGCVARSKYANAKNTVEAQDSVIQSYRTQQTAYKDQIAKLKADLDLANANLREARENANSYRDAHSELAAKFDEIQGSLGFNLPDGVQLVPRADGVAFQVQGEVLFDSGKADIREGGKTALLEIISRLRGTTEMIRVEGHTDNDPVRRHAAEYPLGNLQLSGVRALNVANFLISNGIDSSRVSFAGYGEHQPRASNGSDAGKRENRRVEIVMILDAQN